MRMCVISTLSIGNTQEKKMTIGNGHHSNGHFVREHHILRDWGMIQSLVSELPCVCVHGRGRMALAQRGATRTAWRG